MFVLSRRLSSRPSGASECYKQCGSASCAVTKPTLNGYRRYRPFTNAPPAHAGGVDHRGGMVRVLGRPGDPASRIENRAGEPGANPYLAIAAQIAAGLDDVDRKLDPGPPTSAPYADGAPLLPRDLSGALDALAADDCLRTAFSPASSTTSLDSSRRRSTVST